MALADKAQQIADAIKRMKTALVDTGIATQTQAKSATIFDIADYIESAPMGSRGIARLISDEIETLVLDPALSWNIRDYALYGCENLKDVQPNKTLLSFEKGLSKDASALVGSGVTVVNGYASLIARVGDYAFAGCKNLTFDKFRGILWRTRSLGKHVIDGIADCPVPTGTLDGEPVCIPPRSTLEVDLTLNGKVAISAWDIDPEAFAGFCHLSYRGWASNSGKYSEILNYPRSKVAARRGFYCVRVNMPLTVKSYNGRNRYWIPALKDVPGFPWGFPLDSTYFYGNFTDGIITGNAHDNLVPYLPYIDEDKENPDLHLADYQVSNFTFVMNVGTTEQVKRDTVSMGGYYIYYPAYKRDKEAFSSYRSYNSHLDGLGGSDAIASRLAGVMYDGGAVFDQFTADATKTKSIANRCFSEHWGSYVSDSDAPLIIDSSRPSYTVAPVYTPEQIQRVYAVPTSYHAVTVTASYSYSAAAGGSNPYGWGANQPVNPQPKPDPGNQCTGWRGGVLCPS